MLHVLQVLFLPVFSLASSNAWRRVTVPGDLRQSEMLIEQDFKI
jgi:hypothetical protein